MTSNDKNLFSQAAIQYVLTLPIISLKEARSQLSPPGDWVEMDDLIRLLEAAKRQLFDLRPTGMANLKVVISRDMTMVALVRIKGPQQEIEDCGADESQETSDAGNSESNFFDNSKPLGSEATKRGSQRAIEIAQELIKSYQSGGVANMEDVLEVLSTSPDPNLTRRCLSPQEKYKFDVSAPDFTLTSGGHTDFPKQLESAERFEVTLDNIEDVNQHTVSARLISVNSGMRKPYSDFFKSNKKLKVYIGTSHDALLIRHPGVSLCDELKAEVTLTLNISTGAIDRLTLIRILNKDALKPFITEISKQIEIQFESWQGD